MLLSRVELRVHRVDLHVNVAEGGDRPEVVVARNVACCGQLADGNHMSGLTVCQRCPVDCGVRAACDRAQYHGLANLAVGVEEVVGGHGGGGGGGA